MDANSKNTSLLLVLIVAIVGTVAVITLLSDYVATTQQNSNAIGNALTGPQEKMVPRRLAHCYEWSGNTQRVIMGTDAPSVPVQQGVDTCTRRDFDATESSNVGKFIQARQQCNTNQVESTAQSRCSPQEFIVKFRMVEENYIDSSQSAQPETATQAGTTDQASTSNIIITKQGPEDADICRNVNLEGTQASTDAMGTPRSQSPTDVELGFFTVTTELERAANDPFASQLDYESQYNQDWSYSGQNTFGYAGESYQPTPSNSNSREEITQRFQDSAPSTLSDPFDGFRDEYTWEDFRSGAQVPVEEAETARNGESPVSRAIERNLSQYEYKFATPRILYFRHKYTEQAGVVWIDELEQHPTLKGLPQRNEYQAEAERYCSNLETRGQTTQSPFDPIYDVTARSPSTYEDIRRDPIDSTTSTEEEHESVCDDSVEYPAELQTQSPTGDPYRYKIIDKDMMLFQNKQTGYIGVFSINLTKQKIAETPELSGAFFESESYKEARNLFCSNKDKAVSLSQQEYEGLSQATNRVAETTAGIWSEEEFEAQISNFSQFTNQPLVGTNTDLMRGKQHQKCVQERDGQPPYNEDTLVDCYMKWFYGFGITNQDYEFRAGEYNMVFEVATDGGSEDSVRQEAQQIVENSELQSACAREGGEGLIMDVERKGGFGRLFGSNWESTVYCAKPADVLRTQDHTKWLVEKADEEASTSQQRSSEPFDGFSAGVIPSMEQPHSTYETAKTRAQQLASNDQYVIYQETDQGFMLLAPQALTTIFTGTCRDVKRAAYGSVEGNTILDGNRMIAGKPYRVCDVPKQ